MEDGWLNISCIYKDNLQARKLCSIIQDHTEWERELCGRQSILIHNDICIIHNTQWYLHWHCWSPSDFLYFFYTLSTFENRCNIRSITRIKIKSSQPDILGLEQPMLQPQPAIFSLVEDHRLWTQRLLLQTRYVWLIEWELKHTVWSESVFTYLLIFGRTPVIIPYSMHSILWLLTASSH